jgi:DNA-binding GntR family transcriptional regulator
VAGENLSSNVYQRLKEKIIKLELVPESVVTEQSLMTLLNVGRTPVREAIQRLIWEGWLCAENGKSAHVSYPLSQDLQEIFQYREIVEIAALECIFDHDESKSVAGALDYYVRQMDKNQNDSYMLINSDMQFHRTMLTYMKNGRIIRAWDQIIEELIRMEMIVNYISIEKQENWCINITEHKVLLEALWRKERENSIELLRTHFKLAIDRMMKNLEIDAEDLSRILQRTCP